jgi:hypothetical protein
MASSFRAIPAFSADAVGYMGMEDGAQSRGNAPFIVRRQMGRKARSNADTFRQELVWWLVDTIRGLCRGRRRITHSKSAHPVSLSRSYASD